MVKMAQLTQFFTRQVHKKLIWCDAPARKMEASSKVGISRNDRRLNRLIWSARFANVEKIILIGKTVQLFAAKTNIFSFLSQTCCFMASFQL